MPMCQVPPGVCKGRSLSSSCIDLVYCPINTLEFIIKLGMSLLGDASFFLNPAITLFNVAF